MIYNIFSTPYISSDEYVPENIPHKKNKKLKIMAYSYIVIAIIKRKIYVNCLVFWAHKLMIK
jgi:hypothetical protein